MQYGNGGKVAYVHDEFDRLTGVRYDGETTDRYSYKYGANGRVAIVEDHHLGRTLQSEYDLAERPVQATHRDADGIFYRTTLHYDAQNRLDSFKENVGETLYTTTYAYDKDSRTTQVAYGDEKVEYVYDDLGRLTTRTATNGAAYPTAYAYLPGATENSTTALVSQITHGSGDNALTYSYTYDSRGNITTETRNGLTTTYHYDNLGQLVRVDDPHENATWVYAYDLGGNILSKAKYALNDLTSTPETTSFTYGDTNWKDKLTAVNGVAITYDAIGNPLSDGEWNYEWQAGRQLKKMSKENVTVEFAYDHNGLRTQKKVTENGVTTTTDYTLHGKLITHLTQGSNNLHFYYDANSRPAMVDFNGTKYTYVHNLQGDIVAILDTSGSIVVEYKYDAWGRVIATTGSKSATLGKLNPFRHRGYVYDEETGYYYISSRYYDPKIVRWINADIPETLTAGFENFAQYNLFTYCFNNPANLSDETGTWPSWAKKVVAAVTVVAVVAAVAAVTVATAGAGTAAAVIAVGAAKGAAIGMFSGAAIGAATGAVSHRVSTGSWSGAGMAALNGMGDGALSGAVNGAITGGISRGAQVVRNTKITNARSLPRTSKPLSSNSLVKNGNVNQTRYYNWRGRATLDIDFTNHGTPNVHSMPHAHKWGASGRSGPLNTTFRLGWW